MPRSFGIDILTSRSISNGLLSQRTDRLPLTTTLQHIANMAELPPDPEESNDCLDLNISEGPRKVLETLEQIDRDGFYRRVCLSRNFPSPIRALTTEKLVSEVLHSILSLPNAPHLKISYASATFPIHLLMQALAEDFPLRPALMGHLIPQTINVWMGHCAAAAGAHPALPVGS